MYASRRPASTVSRRFKMYLGYLVLVPLLLVLWIYILLIIKNSFVTNTSIEVNIIDHNVNGITKVERERNFSGEFKQPQEKTKYHVPKFMLELYEKNKSSRKKYAEADLVRSLIPTQAEQLNEDLEVFSENHLLIFDIPTSAKEEKFIGAELKILTQIEIRSEKELGVKKALKISVYDENTKNYSYIRQLQIHHFNDTWLSFNLTKPVGNILQMNCDKNVLKIIITMSALYHKSQNSLTLSIHADTENLDYDHSYPILLLSYSIEDEQYKKQNTVTNKWETKIIRNRRNIEEDYEEETNMIWNGDIPKKNAKKYKKNNCKRRPLYIDFSEIKYNLWIVQPPGYDAFQCQGRCFYPVADHLSPTKHAIMQALIHSVNPSKASRSCCVPTLLDSISILYVDDKGVLTYRYAYKDMVVLECGCR